MLLLYSRPREALLPFRACNYLVEIVFPTNATYNDVPSKLPRSALYHVAPQKRLAWTRKPAHMGQRCMEH